MFYFYRVSGQYRRLPTLTVSLLAGLFMFGAAAQASPVTIANPGFEAQVHGPNTFIFGAPTGWAAYNTAAVVGDSIGTLNPATTTYFLPGQWEGDNVAIAYVRESGTSGVEFGIQQQLSATLAMNTIYTLNVEVGNIASGSSDLGNGPVTFDLDGFPGYRVDLLAGGTLLASDNNSLAAGGNSIPEGEFRTSELVFDSTGVDPLLIGEPLTIALINLNIPDPIDLGADREVNFDNVTLDGSPAVIPLPPALLLFGTALAGLAGFGKRKQRDNN